MLKVSKEWLLAAFVMALPAVSRADDRVVVMISVDGLAGFYFDDAKAEMPNIRKLAAAGARAAGMTAVTPSVTWPNHTTLVTGDYPARHGVTGNNYFDRDNQKKIALIGDPLFDKDQIVKVPTIYDLAKHAGLTTAGIKWPATRNAATLDWQVPDCGKDSLVVKYTTPALMTECVAAGIVPAPKPDDVDDEEKGHKRFDDAASVAAFKLVLHDHKPGFALLHIANVDHMEHQDGPRSPGAYAAVKEADGFVGQVWDEMRRDYPGKATLLVVSDHGFSPIRKSILPNVILREAGMVNVKGIKAVGGQVHVVPQGGAAMVYILDHDHRDEVIDKVTKAFTGVEGVYKIVPPSGLKEYGVADSAVDPHAPDMVLFADMGYSFGDTAAGALSFNDKPEVKGTHGHDPNLPDLQATFVAAGAGIKPGVTLGVIRNTQVAPTLAELIGVKMPDTDGKALTEILDGSAVAGK